MVKNTPTREITMSLKESNFKINIFSLSFTKELEKPFYEDYFQKSLKHVRLALLFGIFFYGIFGILDVWIVPEVKNKLWLIRFGIFIPYAFGVLAFTFSQYFKNICN